MSIAIAIGLIVAYKMYLKNMVQKDGFFPLQRVRLGKGIIAWINPNNWMGPGIIINRNTQEIQELIPEAGWDKQAKFKEIAQTTNTMAAYAKGDDAHRNKYGAMSRQGNLTAAALRGMVPNRSKQNPTVDSTATEIPMLPPAPMIYDAQAAIVAGKPDEWVIGQNEHTGALATFNPARQAHAGILGATGTGKTTSVGFLLVTQAIAHGWHVVILDPDGGIDWGIFSSHAEHHDADAETLYHQVDRIGSLFDSRVDNTESDRPVLIVIEEYGDLIATLRIQEHGKARHVEAVLAQIFQRGRKRRIHIVLIDQYPDNWSKQAVANAKGLFVFQLGPNQGAKVQEYHANKLPDQGSFLHNGTRYETWHAKMEMPRLLAPMPKLNGYRVIKETVAHEAPKPLADQPQKQAAAPSNKWGEFTDQWFGKNPIYFTNPEGGLSNLARAMAEAQEGDTRNYRNYVSTAKQYFDRVREDFNQWAINSTKE